MTLIILPPNRSLRTPLDFLKLRNFLTTHFSSPLRKIRAVNLVFNRKTIHSKIHRKIRASRIMYCLQTKTLITCSVNNKHKKIRMKIMYASQDHFLAWVESKIHCKENHLTMIFSFLKVLKRKRNLKNLLQQFLIFQLRFGDFKLKNLL